MTKNVKGSKGLTAKQIQAVTYLAKGHAQIKVAKSLHVTRQTIANWLKEPEFSASLRKFENEQLEELQKQYSRIEVTAFEVLKEIMGDKQTSPRDRIRAAVELKNESHRLREMRDLEKRIAELEDYVKRMEQKDEDQSFRRSM